MTVGQLYSNGLWNPFTGKKKYTITCFKCRHSWVEKVLARNDLASAVCPCCKVQNTWSHSAFGNYYDSVMRKP